MKKSHVIFWCSPRMAGPDELSIIKENKGFSESINPILVSVTADPYYRDR